MIAEPNESDLLEFLYACPIGLVQINRSGEITMINPYAMKHLLPLAPESARNMGNLFAVLEHCAPELRNMIEHFPKARGQVCENHRIIVDLRSSGSAVRKTLACTTTKLGDDRSIVTLMDVTAQVEQERRLKQVEAWFSSLLGGVNNYAVLVIASDGTVQGVNDCFTRQTQHTCEEVEGRPLADFLDVDRAPGAVFMADQFRIAATEGWSLDEAWQRRRDGEQYWCQRLVVARKGRPLAGSDGFMIVLRDVVHQPTDTDNLRRLLTQDHLTGAANRAQFLQHLEAAYSLWQRHQQPVSLVTIDIDHFKRINDTFGHPVGDQVLRVVTQRCKAALRFGSVFARVGGEEFAAVLPETDSAEAVSAAERLRAAISAAPIAVSGEEITVTASLGYATASGSDQTIDALMKVADDRLYAAKRSGRNRVGGLEEVKALASTY